jgi:hypothetical protein
MKLVAPRAVRIADAIDAMICTIHLRVSFFVIIYLLPILHYPSYIIHHLATRIEAA